MYKNQPEIIYNIFPISIYALINLEVIKRFH